MLLTAALCACQRAPAPVVAPVVARPVPAPPPPRVIPPEPAVDTRHVTTVDLRRR
jgi:hypothetical protein